MSAWSNLGVGVVIFVDNSDPYADDLEAALSESEAAILAANSQTRHWSTQHPSPSEGESHGLETLSTAAVHDRLSYPPFSVDQQQALTATDGGSAFNTVSTTSISSGPSPNPPRSAIPSLASPPISITSSSNNTNNNINFLLNPSSQSLSPPVEPTIQHGPERRGSSLTSRSLVSRGGKPVEQRSDMPVETEHEIAFLLRNFAEAPGLW